MTMIWISLLSVLEQTKIICKYPEVMIYQFLQLSAIYETCGRIFYSLHGRNSLFVSSLYLGQSIQHLDVSVDSGVLLEGLEGWSGQARNLQPRQDGEIRNGETAESDEAVLG